MLFGQLFTSINKEGQIVIPTNLATTLSKKLFITQGLDRNLLIIPENAFRILYEQLQGLNLVDPKARILLRIILGSAYEAQLDSTNHLELPDYLKRFANLDSSVFLIGQGSFLEIWNPSDWSRQELFCQDVETDPDKFRHLNIALG